MSADFQDSHTVPPDHQVVVLLVDDDPFVLSVQRRIVTRYGFECLSAESGIEALEVLAARPEVDLIVIDAMLPDVSGAALLRELKALKPSVRAIACSGLVEDEPTQAMFEAGADDFIPKPFSAADLVGHMRSVLASQSGVGGCTGRAT